MFVTSLELKKTQAILKLSIAQYLYRFRQTGTIQNFIMGMMICIKPISHEMLLSYCHIIYSAITEWNGTLHPIT